MSRISARMGINTLQLSVAALVLLATGALVWGVLVDRPTQAPERTKSDPVIRAIRKIEQTVDTTPLPAIARKPRFANEVALLAAADNGEIPKSMAFVRHTPPPSMRDRLLERLHNEALAHFYSDPRNGFSRMPVVYKKMTREWKLPEFASGDLGTEKKIPFEEDLKRIHAGSLKDFDKRKVVAKTKRINTVIRNFKNFDRKKFDAKKVWEAKSVDLVGLIKHRDPVAYVSEKLPDMQKLDKVPIRELDDFESSGLSTLYAGRDYYARSHSGVVRMLGAVRAQKNCLSCHTTKKEGDLLGAFSYTLREAKYQRGVRRFLNTPKLQKLKTTLQQKAGK